MKTGFQRWLEAVFPDDHFVLGMRLHAFTLGHTILLNRLGNGFVDPDGAPSFDDLITGVFICSRPHDEALREIGSPSTRLQCWLWGKLFRRFDIIKAMGAFQGYIAAHSDSPDVMGLADESARTPGAPFLLRIKLTLQGEMGYSEADALSKPLGAALWEVCAWFEMKTSKVKILNAAEELNSDADELRALVEQLQKEEPGKWDSLL